MNSVPHCFSLSPGQTTKRWLAVLSKAGYHAVGPKTTDEADVYFDTQDGRFFRASQRLRRHTQKTAVSWQLLSADRVILEQTTKGQQPPARFTESGAHRRLIPQVETAIHEDRYRVGSRSPVFVIEQRWRFRDPLVPTAWIDGPRVLCVEAAGGAPTTRESCAVADTLRDAAHLTPLTTDALVAGLAAIGSPLPGAPMPDEYLLLLADSAATAVRKNLAKQGYRMWAQTRGALLDLDPEFVHDLRVATRRARFALRLLDVDDQTSWAAHVREELSWIAASLGAVRDLDVFLLRLPELYARAEAPAAVRAFVTRQFRSSRAVALRELVAALSSKRFHQLLADLQSAMTTERISLPPEAAESSALDLSGRSINQAARRVRRWTPIRPESAANLHRLRIAFKRLRYTCEFFADLYLDGLQPFIRRFVKMQDLLGRHQDAVVAAENFRRLAATVASAAQPATERLVFLGALIQLQREEMNDAQVRLDARWKRNRKQIKKLLRFVEQTGPEKENEEPPGDKDH